MLHKVFLQILETLGKKLSFSQWLIFGIFSFADDLVFKI